MTNGTETKPLEERTFELEEKKFVASQQWEEIKLALEKGKAKWTALSIIASVFLGSLAIVSSAYLQYATARTQFELKAAELTLQTNDPVVTRTKVDEFAALFPGRLPTDWKSASFDPRNFFSESDDLKNDVAKLLVEHPDRRDDIFLIYGTLFQEGPTQTFLKRLSEKTPNVGTPKPKAPKSK
jgi:hypothetical protein